MGRRAQLIPLAVLLALVGCASPPPPRTPDTTPEVVVALKELNQEWLRYCEGLGDRPGSATGDLLQDFNDAASLGGACKARQKALVDYIAPLVEKAKAYRP